MNVVSVELIQGRSIESNRRKIPVVDMGGVVVLAKCEMSFYDMNLVRDFIEGSSATAVQYI